jgi:hypothetical protein
VHDLVAPLAGHLAQVVQLRLGMLVESRDSHIQRCALQTRRPFFIGVVDPCLMT